MKPATPSHSCDQTSDPQQSGKSDVLPGRRPSPSFLKAVAAVEKMADKPKK